MVGRLAKTVAEAAKRGTDFFAPIIDRSWYKAWLSGKVPDRAGAYATNARIPSVEEVIRDGIFCMGVPTIWRLLNGLEVATLGNEDFDGGVVAYFGSTPNAPADFPRVGYFEKRGTLKRFSLADAEPYDLLGYKFNSAALGDQGHGAILMPDGTLLESLVRTGPTRRRRLKDVAGEFTVMVKGKDWLLPKGTSPGGGGSTPGKKYKVVDLRGELPGSPAASQGAQRKTAGAVVHYNGDPDGTTGVASGQRVPRDVYEADAFYHIEKNWGTPSDPAYANGIQYHYGVWGDTVYVLRNPDARLWHCGDGVASGSRNYAATAVNVPISSQERASAETLVTLEAFLDDEMRRQGLKTRAVKGHQEITPTACPGSLMGDFVEPYRAKALPLAPSNPSDPNDSLTGKAVHSAARVLAYATDKDAAPPALEMAPAVYAYAAQRDLRPDVLSAQMFLETGFGRYGGASRRYNPAGVKKADAAGDDPSDFEIPATPDEGARMLVNHWCALLGKAPIGVPHERYWVAREVYKNRSSITSIGQLGNGNWAADPQYAEKLRRILAEIAATPEPAPPKPPVEPPEPPSPPPAPVDLADKVEALEKHLEAVYERLDLLEQPANVPPFAEIRPVKERPMEPETKPNKAIAAALVGITGVLAQYVATGEFDAGEFATSLTTLISVALVFYVSNKPSGRG